MNTATITNVTALKKVLPTIASLNSEARVSIGPNSLSISGMDTATVAHTAFTFRSVETTASFDVCLQLGFFVDAIKKVKDGEPVTITLEENKLVVEYEKPRKTKHELPLLSEELGIQAVPRPDKFKVRTLVKSAELQDAIEEAAKVSDSVAFYGDNKGFRLVASSETRRYTAEVTTIRNEVSSSDESFRSKFSTEYLQTLLSPGKFYEEVEFQMATDYPIVFLYEDATSTLRFLLAPRVEND